MEHESDSDTNRNWCTSYSHQRIGAGKEGIGNKRMSGNHPDSSIVDIDQNTEKSFGDFRGLVVT